MLQDKLRGWFKLEYHFKISADLQLHCDCKRLKKKTTTKWKCGSCSWGFTCVGSPDCKYWCRLHSSGSPKLSRGSRLELIAGNRRLHPSAGKQREREQVGLSSRLVSWRGKGDCRCVKPGENDNVRSVKIKRDSKLIPFAVFYVQINSVN